MCPLTDQQGAKFECLLHYFTEAIRELSAPDGDCGSQHLEIIRKVWDNVWGRRSLYPATSADLQGRSPD